MRAARVGWRLAGRCSSGAPLQSVRGRRGKRSSTVSASSSESASAPPPSPFPKLRYYSAWFCPFAHRATLALEHHGVAYDWVEALGWEVGMAATGSEAFDARAREEWWYHWKHPDLLRANPQGMVPTLESVEDGRVVTESSICVEFVDAVATAGGASQAPPLVSRDPFEAARQRLWADRVNKSVTNEYYKCLVRPSAEERRAAFDRLVQGCRDFARHARGDFFSGDSLGLVDCIILPYAYRLYVFEHYRGFTMPRDNADLVWFHAWLDRAVNLPAVKKTLPDKDRYLAHVQKYASGKARSKVGNAVRRGAEAHDYDHTTDGEEAGAASPREE